MVIILSGDSVAGDVPDDMDIGFLQGCRLKPVPHNIVGIDQKTVQVTDLVVESTRLNIFGEGEWL